MPSFISQFHCRQIHGGCSSLAGVPPFFLKMLSGLSSYEWRKVPFAAWLMRIAHNEVVNFTRKNGRRALDTELPEELIDRQNDDPAEATARQLALSFVCRICLCSVERNTISCSWNGTIARRAFRATRVCTRSSKHGCCELRMRSPLRSDPVRRRCMWHWRSWA